MAALTRHAKAPAVLGNRRNQGYCNWLPLGPATVGNRPSIDEWLLPAAAGGDATVTPAAIAVTVAVPAPVAVGQPPPVVTHRSSVGGGVSATQTITSGTFTPTANSKLVVVARCIKDNHTTAFSWSISDTGSLGTWVNDLTGPDATATGSPNFHTQIKVWSIDVGGSPPSNITVTVDAFAGTQLGYYAVSVFDVTGHNTSSWLAQSDFDLATGGSTTPALGSAPTGTSALVVVAFAQALNNITWAAPPAGWTSLAAVAAGYASVRLAWSTTDADGSVNITYTADDTAFDVEGLVIEIAASGGGGGGATVTPTVVAAVVTVPQPAVSVAAAPAQVSAATSVPAPGIAVAAAPAALAALVSSPQPAVSVGAAPAAVAAVTTVPTPTAGQTGGGGATATPAAVAATSTLPQPAVSVGAAPTTVATVATVPAPTALTGARATPSAVAAVAAVPAPAVAVGAAPVTVATVTALPAPTVLTGTGSAPAAIAATTTVPKPNVAVGAAPAPIAVTVAMPAPSVVVAFTVAPAAIIVAITVPGPRVAVGAAPATVAVVVAIGTPTIPGSGTGLWSWYLRRSGAWLPASPLLDGVHSTTTDVT